MNSSAPHPDLPDGYVARPLSMDDACAVASLLNDYCQRLRGENDADADDLRVEWSSPDWSPEKGAVVVVAPDGGIAAYADYFDTLEPHVRPYAWCRVHPDHHGLGIGQWAAAWVEAKGTETLPRAPEGARVGVLTGLLQEDGPAHDLLEGRGWNHVRTYYTMRVAFDGPPPAPRIPEGITIRTFRKGEPLNDLAIAVDDCFSDHWGHVPAPVEDLVKHWEHWVENDPKHDPSLWFLADADGVIAGMSLCSEEEEGEPDRGWCGTLGVRREFRRKGLGLALLRVSFEEIHRRGKKGLSLGVDATSLTGATRLYEKAGMKVARQSDTYEFLVRDGEDLMTRDVT